MAWNKTDFIVNVITVIDIAATVIIIIIITKL